MTTKSIPEAKKVKIEVKVPLDEEMAEHRGVKLAALGIDLRRVQQLAKDEGAARRKEIKEAKKVIATLEDEISSKTTLAMVDAEERANFDTNTVVTVRTDPEGYGVIVSERAMSAEERQIAIDLGDEPLSEREPAKVVRLPKRKEKAQTPPPGAH